MKNLSIISFLLLTMISSLFASEKDAKDRYPKGTMVLTDADRVTDPDLIKKLNAIIPPQEGREKSGFRKMPECDPIQSPFSTFITINSQNVGKLKPHCLSYVDINNEAGPYQSHFEFMDYSLADNYLAYQYVFIDNPDDPNDEYECEETDTDYLTNVTWFSTPGYIGPGVIDLDTPIMTNINDDCHYEVHLITARLTNDGTSAFGGNSNIENLTYAY